ncbi:prolyl oligopeptidase family serine peptidase [Caulobacter sp. SLTY]|uniref:S9 family peptidase n=1 Tax=Caulobacter sp. SLTY TaxID=2683262 RepID=UPI0014135328|nr:S9 family peptidase [Caulobacter sp. SLTY]NBB15993.1 prolyl oligopeptidase family serine peptidase [Caulobacter sp. SLTY]
MRYAAAGLTAAFAATLAAGAWVAAAPAAEAPLIPRASFFGNPTKTAGRLSPDGKWMAWIAPRDGVLNIWVAPAADPAAAKPLTDEKQRPIRQYFWAQDSSTILFVNDKGGDENFLLYGVDITTGAQKALTPFENTRVYVAGTSKDRPDTVLVGVNNRDPKWHDAWEINLKTGAMKEVFRNDGFGAMTADEQLVPRIAAKVNDDGSVDYFKIVDGKAEAKPFTQVSFQDNDTSPLGFTQDGKTLYWADTRGRDKTAIVAQDWATGKTTLIAESDKADVAPALFNPTTGKLEAYVVNYLKNDWKALDPAIQADIDFLKTELKGEIGIASRTDADDRWIVGVDPVTAPASTWLYDRKARKLTKLYTSRPELEGQTLAAMYPVEIKSRDGKTLVSYLTLPAGTDPDGDGKPDKAVPMVLFVHGGPWARDRYGYNGAHQWYSNRGYAVLSVNYRGSTGFGKAFTRSSDGEWAGKMHDDLIDAVDWAVKGGIAQKDKVAITGGSYGGYATLVGMTFTPDTFACGVDIVGPSNLKTLYDTFPPYWTSGLSIWRKALGDPNTPEGLKLMQDRSPINRVDAIKRPLLIGQGANDPRVKKSESDQIVEVMKAKNIPVTYVLFPDEGHGFARPVNNMAFTATEEHFLAKCLGGRAEPYGTVLNGSSIQVPHGAEYAPGLKEALSTKK